ncbi:unnamed protein product [Lasius platythorax]|uniref:HAT C-terminal dimerisation domain-containing protein n=1 Tax=Lasius platythorax TaxID=488582 RepID=A0AAV2NEQ4_9HYME
MKPALLKPEVFGHILRTVNFSDRVNHLPLEETDFGFECKEYLEEQINQKILSKIDVDLIRENYLQFYIKASEQIRDRLPIDDNFLYCVAVFNNKIALFECDRESTVLKVLQVNHRLGKLVDVNEMRSEWKSLYEVDLPTKSDWSKLSFDDMWIQIGLYSVDNKIRFPNLGSLLSVVRALPHSNAEAERVFSIIPDAKTRKRNNMSIETLNSICVIKYALKAHNKTARTMAVTREHLALMTAENVYRKSLSNQQNNLTLHSHDDEKEI